MSKTDELRALLNSGDTLVMPDAYDPLSTRLIERLGFRAVQCSGYSMALATCCPSEAELGFERNLAITLEIVNAVTVPVMADGEDGFGDPSAVAATVTAFVKAGVAGINLEDQVLGRPPPKRIIGCDLMIEKLQAARLAAERSGQPGLVINGRTDALAVAADRHAGIEEAICRANAYLQAGADLAFVTGVATLDEVKALVRGIKGPLSIAAGLPYNIKNMSIADLRSCGVARVSLPMIAVMATIGALKQTLASIRDSSSFAATLEANSVCSVEDMAKLCAKCGKL